jgi:elongation factor G
MMDKEHADFDRAYRRSRSGSPQGGPGRDPDRRRRRVPRRDQPLHAARLHVHRRARKGEYVEADIPAESRRASSATAPSWSRRSAPPTTRCSSAISTGNEIGRDEAIHGMKEAMKRPISSRSSASPREHDRGARAAHRARAAHAVGLRDGGDPRAHRRRRGQTVEIHAQATTPHSRRSSSRRSSEPHVGDVSYFRILSGKVENGAEVYNATRDGVGEARASLRAAGEGAHRGPACCTPATSAAWPSCATRTPTTRSPRANIPMRLPQIASPSRSCTSRSRRGARRRGEAAAGAAPAARRGSHVQVHYNPRRTRPSSGASASGTSTWRWRAQAQVRREGRAHAPRIAYRETITAQGRGAGAPQEADGWPRAVRRLLDPHGPAPRGEGYLFEDKIVGGVIPSAVHPGGGSGRPGGGARGVLAASRSWTSGRGVRRLVPLGGLERDVVQDGGHPRLQDGRAEVQAR